MSDSQEYKKRRQFYGGMLTLYGRNSVVEALKHPSVQPFRLHLADSNRPSPVLDQIRALAEQRGAEILTHSRRELSRISRNGQQDQGVAADLILAGYRNADDFLAEPPDRFSLMALDRVTNPQNLGLVIRSVAASPMTGLLLSRQGGAPRGPLAIKASAGAVFSAHILMCDDLAESLARFRNSGARIVGMSADGNESIEHYRNAEREIFLLGNETTGLSKPILGLCDLTLKIPINSAVESLNVSAAATIVAFLPLLRGEERGKQQTRASPQ